MGDVQPWKNPRDVSSFPDMDKLKPWQPSATRASDMPNMDQLKPWAEQPQIDQKPPPGPEIQNDIPAPPGWYQVAKSSFGRGVAQEAADLATGTRMLLPEGVGGYTAEQQYQKGLATAEHKDYTDKLLQQGIGEGWTHPDWWIAKIANNVGGLAPPLAGAAAASATPLGPLGGIGVFAGEAAIANLPRAYNAARAKGLDETQAIHRAIIDSGIAASFAGLMGIAGKLSVTGAISGKVAPYISEGVADILQRPVTESLIQLGVVQPGLMAGQDIATAGSHGELPEMDQLLTDVATNSLVGLGVHQVFKERGPKEVFKEPDVGTAGEGTIGEAAAAQAGLREREPGKPEPAAPVAVPSPDQPDIPDDNQFHPRDLTPRTRIDGEPQFGGVSPEAIYSKMGDAIAEMPDKIPSKDVMPQLMKKGFTEEEIKDTFIPRYLEGAAGKVNKNELQTWVDMNKTEVLEKIGKAGPESTLGVQDNPRDFAFRTPLTKLAATAAGDMPPDSGAYARANVNIAKDRDSKWNMVVNNLKAEEKAPGLAAGVDPREVAAKRLMQVAAERGIDRIAYDGKDAGLRKIFEKQARMFGEKRGETNFKDRAGDPLAYVDVSHKMAEHTHRDGHALFDTDLQVKSHPAKGTKTLSDFIQTNPVPDYFKADFLKIGQMINKTANHLGISRGITFEPETNPNARYRGFLKESEVDPLTGNYVIRVNLHRLMNRNELYASMTHEFGHVIFVDKYKTETDPVKAALKADFEAKRAIREDPKSTVGDIRRYRDNAISQMAKGRAMHDHYLLSDLVPKYKEYFLSYEEHFAEQVAKWMQTDERPLSVADGFFKRLGNVIRRMIVDFRKLRDGPNADPDKAIRDWLNNKFDQPKNWIEPHARQFDMDTTKAAQEHFDREGAPETTAVPMQGSTAGGRIMMGKLPPGSIGNNGNAMPAHADRMNWFYKLFTGLPQLARLNKGIAQLANYTGMHRAAFMQKTQIIAAAQRRLAEWSKLDPKQQFALTNFIQDYAHLDARPDDATFRDLVKQHKLSDQTVKMFQGVVKDFDGFLDSYRRLLVKDALEIKDPVQQARTMTNINTRFDEFQRRPFMPITHFGKYRITVYAADGSIIHEEGTNSLKRQAQIRDALRASPDRLPGEQVLSGLVPKDVAPFMGMPPGLINLMGDKLNLSPTQRAMLDQLRFDYAPSQTFKHQFRNLDLVPGYSTDFMRAYAHFFFHGANHMSRVTWIDQMRDQIASLGSQQERLARTGNLRGANKLDMIVRYMQEHLDAWANPKNDWAGLRGLMFHFYLGANPASAATNLTQTALSTYPWMASQYGDIATIKALTKASFDLNNFYKKGTLQDMAANAPKGPEGAWWRAIGEAVNGGTLTESQAHQLAAISEDRNLMRPFGTKAEKAWLKFQDASSWMFDLSEQYNRRVAFRAAWDVAMKVGPDHKAVKEAITQDPILFNRLTATEDQGGRNWSKQEAAAYVAAKYAVDTTQFEYQPYARPPAFRGKIGSNVFIFKQFTQNMLFNLASNPGMLGRWLVIMGAIGGLGGLPGYDNVNSIIKTIAARLFGKDFDLDDEVRSFAHDVLNDGIGPDTLLHGQAHKGFGIPQVMHSLGAAWFPTVDMSRNVGMGDVLGFDPMRLTGLAPSLHPKEEELRQIGRASGATFGMLPSLFDFASSNQNFTDLKKYESIMPHWAGAISHAYRWYTEGRETNAAGNTIVRFNPQDTEHMMEILARGLGFQPRRYTEELARIQAIKEQGDFWDLRHRGLLRQIGDAIKNQNDEQKEAAIAAIKKYNQELPEEARMKVITSKEIKASVSQRMKVQAKQEAGIPVEKSNIPIKQALEPYYPRGWAPDQVGAKPVQ